MKKANTIEKEKNQNRASDKNIKNHFQKNKMSMK